MKFLWQPGNQRTFLLLHGTGGDEDSLLPIARHFDPGAAVLAPRGEVLEQGAARFFRRYAEGSFDLPDWRERGKRLGQWVHEQAHLHSIDLSQCVAVGYSNGANIATSMALQGLQLASWVLLRPTYIGPLEGAQAKGQKVLLCNGQFDPLTRPQLIAQLEQQWVQAGAEVHSQRLQAGHELVREDLERGAEWIDYKPSFKKV